MTWNGVPYFVDGATHPAEVMRLVSYRGGEGVVGAADCKVTASAIPDGNIHIAPGAIALLNQSPGGQGQGYFVMNDGDEVKALDPQGSSGGRYDLVAVVLEDPQYPGQPNPASAANGPYEKTRIYKNVAATTRSLSEVDADQTGYALALVHFDASDGTITNADITDLRELLNTNQQTEKFVLNGVASANLPNALGVAPAGASWAVKVPTWATRAVIEARWSGVKMADTGGGNGQATGKARVDIGAVQSDVTNWQADATGANKPTTQTMIAADEVDVSAIAGTTVNLRALLSKESGNGLTASTTQFTTVVAEVTFKEVPV